MGVTGSCMGRRTSGEEGWSGSVGGSHEETHRWLQQRWVGGSPVKFEDLPEEIVQPLARLGAALYEHAQAHRDHSLAEHEDGVLSAWRAVAPGVLEAVLQLATTGLEKQ